MNINVNAWTRRLVLSGSALMLSVSVGGCGDDHDHDHDHEQVLPLEDACEHLADGPNEAVTAAADGETGPDITEDHTRWDITLTAVDGGNGGSVTFAPAEAGEFLFAMTADIPAMLFDGNGNEVALSAPGAEDGTCDLAQASYAVDAAIGTYTLSFGPTDATTVQLVVVHAGEHDHDHE